MRIRAAVVEEKAGPFVLRDLSLGEPRPDEVLVRVVAAGICATDLHIRDQGYPVPLPVVPGHEGAGVVEAVGTGVTAVAPGDHVIMSYPYCGRCRYCRSAANAYCEHGFSLSFGGSRLDGSSALSGDGGTVAGHVFQQSSFATHALATERNVVPVPPDVPLEIAAPFACGVQTGAGAVLNVLGVRPGSSIAVFGTGTVGLAAVLAARLAGAGTIVAVDVVAERLALATELGATHTVDGRDDDLAGALDRIAPGGLDRVLEVTAIPRMLTLAVAALAMTGRAALVGGAPAGTRAEIDMNTLLNGRSVRGVIQGDSVPQLFIPELIEHHRRGRFPVDRLVRVYDFDDIGTAVDDMQSGRTIKPVLRIGTV